MTMTATSDGELSQDGVAHFQVQLELVFILIHPVYILLRVQDGSDSMPYF